MQYDLVIKGGRYFAPDGMFHDNNAIFVKDGRISYIARANETGLPEAAKTIDASGMTILPGLKDSHLHLLGFGMTQAMVDLRGLDSIEAVKNALVEFIKVHNIKPGEWVIGRGWNQNLFSDRALPTAKDLDVVADNPVIITRVCGHIGCVNSAALKLMGITKDTPDPDGGVFSRDENGELTGMLLEGALGYGYSSMSPPTFEQLEAALKMAMKHAVSRGLTGVHTDDLGYAGGYMNAVKLYERLFETDSLDMPVYLEMLVPDLKELKALLAELNDYMPMNPKIRIGNVKILLDGSLGARTAAMLEPYADAPGEIGLLNTKPEELDEMVELAHNAGYQLAIHTIGDRALKHALDAIEKAQDKHPRQNTRHRIVHCQFASEELFAKMARLGVLGDVQPCFVPTDMPIIESRVGVERAKWSYAWKTMQQMGIHISGGTDCPIEALDPLPNIAAAMYRAGFNMSESLNIAESIKLLSEDVCYADFTEKTNGTIANFMTADFTIVPGDLENDTENVLNANKIAYTIVGGRVVYSATE